MTKEKTIFSVMDNLLRNQVEKQGHPFFTRSEIENLCESGCEYVWDKKSANPSDYCYDRFNEDKSKQNILHKSLVYLGPASYRYIGKNHPYTGKVSHKEKGARYEKIVGEWRNGYYCHFRDPTTVVDNEKVVDSDSINELYEEYMGIFSKEVESYGFKPTELRHLVGRIGELMCAIETKGSLALKTNQKGFDVISGKGKRISVKTTAQELIKGKRYPSVSINPNTLGEVDELMVIWYTEEEFKIVCHVPKKKLEEEFKLCSDKNTGKLKNVNVGIAKAKKLQEELDRENQ